MSTMVRRSQALKAPGTFQSGANPANPGRPEADTSGGCLIPTVLRASGFTAQLTGKSSFTISLTIHTPVLRTDSASSQSRPRNDQ